ncbi:MAG: TIGR01212 family radical SAM protein [Ruminococcaceae bacterium]|nr:TIGR01212 family radical SAM protein [Oscillospiraceae bacterium]
MYYYNSYNEAMQRLFGEKVYKLSLSSGCSCPNRDGTLGTRGCSFCAEGSGDFAETGDVHAQIESAKARMAGKFKGSRYIAYFQSYTNTYGDVSRLRSLYRPLLERDDIAGLSIATRPDCLGQDIMELLAELAAVKPLWVELGLQTIHAETAKSIRRGYELPVFDEAVAKLRSIGARVVVHVILGLPGESRERMLDTVRYVGRCGAEGIKLQLLHVLDGTDLAADYAAGKFKVMELDEYAQLLSDCLKLLPPDMVIHRLTGDGAKKRLIAPAWSGDKKRVLNRIRSVLERENTVQGSGI